MNDRLRPLLSRVLAPLILTVLVKLFDLVGVPMPAELPELVAEISVALVTYALIHRGIDKVINPGDAASSTLAGIEKDQTQLAKDNLQARDSFL